MKTRAGGAGGAAHGLGPGELGGDLGFKPGVAGMAEDVVDPVPLAPGHQRIAGEAAVGAQQNLHAPPAGADLADDALDLLDRTGGSVDVRAPELGREQVPTAEHVERQIAPAVIIAVEEPPLLMPVQRIVGRIEVENYLRGRLAVGVEEQLDEQPLDRRRIMADPVIACRLARRRMLEPIERALAGERRTARSSRLEFAGQDRHRRIVPQLIVVERVLISQCQADDPLADQRGDLVLDPVRRAPIAETAGKPLDKPDRLVRGPQQQRAGIRGHRTAVECRHHTATIDHSKLELLRATVCGHRGSPLRRSKSLWQKSYGRFRAPMHLPFVRNAG